MDIKSVAVLYGLTIAGVMVARKKNLISKEVNDLFADLMIDAPAGVLVKVANAVRGGAKPPQVAAAATAPPAP